MVKDLTYIDFFASFHRVFVANQVTKNRLLRYWGTTHVDGIHVFNKTFTVYPSVERIAVRKVCGAFGMYSSIKTEDFSSVAEFYLTFNEGKLSTTDVYEYTSGILATKFNLFLEQGVPVSTYLNLTLRSNPEVFNSMTAQEIVTYVETNYESLYDSLIIDSDGEKLSTALLGRYALFDKGEHFTISGASAQVVPIPSVKKDPLRGTSVTTYTSSVSIKFTVTQNSEVSADSRIITSMLNEVNQEATRKLDALARLTEDPEYDGQQGYAITALLGEEPTTDDVWYKGYLRVSASDRSVLSGNEFADIINSTLDTGTVKKKVKWYKKALSIVLTIVAIVAAFVPGGQWVSMLALAALAGVQMYWSKHGSEGAAEYAGKWAKFASIATFFLGIQSMLENLAKEIAKGALQAAIAIGTTFLRTAVALGISVDSKILAVASLATGDVSGFGTDTFKTLSITMNVLQNITSFRNSMIVGDLTKELAYANQAYLESEQELADEMDKSMNLLIEDIKNYTKPLDVAESQYSVNKDYTGTGKNISKNTFYPSGLNLKAEELMKA